MKGFNILLAIVTWSVFICSPTLAQENQQQKEIDSLKTVLNTLSASLNGVKNLKVTGWIQMQYQWTDLNGTKTFEGGDFQPNSNNRFTIRRGRVKFTYVNGLTQYVLQLNATERGMNLVDAYIKLYDPWKKGFSVTAGVMNRPFGFEIDQSSQVRETPERSRFTQTLLPNERDLGAMLTYEPLKGKKLYGLKASGGFYNGTGIVVPGSNAAFAWVSDYDSYKDFIGKAHYERTVAKEKVSFGFGASHYNGGFIYQSNQVFKSIGTDSLGVKTWSQADTINQTYKNGKAPRIYYGLDAQVSVKSKLGTTSIRTEYVWGTQSGTQNSSRSSFALPSSTSTYVRSFNGGHIYFVQRIGKTKHEVVLKYEWYDPNTKIKGSEILPSSGMSEAELKYTTLGVGYLWYATDNVKLMLHYSLLANETTRDLSKYTKDIRDNVLTIRLQYRF